MDDMVTLGTDEQRRRALRLKLVLTDCDGVLTDAGVYYSAEGEALKRFNLRDGMGVELLRQDGIETGIITRENSAIVARRAEKLRLQHLYLGVQDKRSHLAQILKCSDTTPDQLGYIGDDVNDLKIIQEISPAGLTACPADALPAVRDEVHYRCATAGGHGAFRDFAEWILGLRGP